MINENIKARKNDLKCGVEHALKGVDCKVTEGEISISIQLYQSAAIVVSVEEKGYCIYNVNEEWAKITTYFCEKEEEEDIIYYLDSIDECIGEIQRWVNFACKPISNPIKNDGTLLSAFESIRDQYTELEFTNENAKNKKVKNAVYIYPKKMHRHGEVIFEIWKKPRAGTYDLYIKREYMTNEEYAMSDQASGQRGMITRIFESDPQLIEFLIPKLDAANSR